VLGVVCGSFECFRYRGIATTSRAKAAAVGIAADHRAQATVLAAAGVPVVAEAAVARVAAAAPASGTAVVEAAEAVEVAAVPSLPTVHPERRSTSARGPSYSDKRLLECYCYLPYDRSSTLSSNTTRTAGSARMRQMTRLPR